MSLVKRVLISGSDGQLCSDLYSNLKLHGDKFLTIARNREELDVTDPKLIEHYFEDLRPDIVINGASCHNVEQIENNPSLACEVNIVAVKNMAQLANKYDSLLINFSTDYVLGSDSSQALTSEGFTEFAKVDPLNFYGVTKAAGEMTLKAICNKYFNIRVSSLFGKKGSSAKNWSNFPYMIMNKYNGKDVTKVVSYQIISIAYTKDISEVLVDMLIHDVQEYGTWNIVNRGVLSWYKFAKYIYELMGWDVNLLEAVKASEFYSNVKRPNFSALDCYRLRKCKELKQMPDWKDAVKRFLQEIEKIK